MAVCGCTICTFVHARPTERITEHNTEHNTERGKLMEYMTSTGTSSQPPQQPSGWSGVDAQGVLTLTVLIAISIVVKRSSGMPGKKNRDRLGPRIIKGVRKLSSPPPKQQETDPGLPADLVPFLVEGENSGPTPESGLVPAPTVERFASLQKLESTTALGSDIPAELMTRLQVPAWDAMCGARKLSGLHLGALESSPYGVVAHVSFGGALDFASVQRNLDQLETGLDMPDNTLRLRKGSTAGRGLLDIRLRDPLAGENPWTEPRGPVRLRDPVQLAVTPFGDTISVSVKQRLGIFGTSGSGKSCVQRLVGAHVIQTDDADLEVWDLKFGIESQHYAGMAHRVTTVPDALTRTQWLIDEEFPRRADLLREQRSSQWRETPENRARVIIVDEGNVLVRDFTDPQLRSFFRVVEQGRALGVYVVWATQFPKSTNLPTELRSQLNCRISLKLLSAEESRTVFKDDVAKGWTPHELLGPGWLLVKDEEHRVPVEAKALWLSEDTFRTLSTDNRTTGQRGTDNVPDNGTTPGTRDTGQPDNGTGGRDTGHADADNGTTSGTVSEDIWTVLALSQDNPHLSEIARRTGRSKAAVHAALARLLEEGSVIQEGSGYTLRTAEGGGNDTCI